MIGVMSPSHVTAVSGLLFQTAAVGGLKQKGMHVLRAAEMFRAQQSMVAFHLRRERKHDSNACKLRRSAADEPRQ